MAQVDRGLMVAKTVLITGATSGIGKATGDCSCTHSPLPRCWWQVPPSAPA